MSIRVSFAVDPAYKIAPVNRRTFGSFVEHMGRCVYTGIYEPEHPAADEDGFRRDVLELIRELGVAVVRYPGGNFVSNYRWEDGVGPRERRPRRLDLAWGSTETNQFGLDEFMKWTAKAGVEPMIAMNLGTRGVQDALDLLEYANVPRGTKLSDLRVANGADRPHGIRMWCLGNELDGPWQVGHKTAHEYGRLAIETARAMRLVSPDVELVACGSSSSSMPTFGAWEREVLELAYEEVDYISCHAYYDPGAGDLASFLASALDMDHFVSTVAAIADQVGHQLHNPKRINISFDEWNVWSIGRYQAVGRLQGWPVAPRIIEDEYTVADAVVVGNLLISLLRHSDRVTAACLAQLVNVIAPIRTEPGGASWRQAIFHPFALTSRHAAGDVLRIEPATPSYETTKYGPVPFVDAVATHDVESRQTVLFVVNRSVDQAVELDADVRGVRAGVLVEAVTLTDRDVQATNTEEQPNRVIPRALDVAILTDGAMHAVLPPVSWSMLRLS
ncbi:MAG TPA: alpha-N-arabinofuranosidase [Candidatus Dormibacteraeota bacterium]